MHALWALTTRWPLCPRHLIGLRTLIDPASSSPLPVVRALSYQSKPLVGTTNDANKDDLFTAVYV